MSTKSIKRKFDWILENVTREKLEAPSFRKYSDPIIIDLFGNKTEWNLYYEVKNENLGVYLRYVNIDRDGFCVKFRASKTHYYTKAVDTLLKTGYGWTKFLSFDELFDPVFNHIDESSCFKRSFEVKL
jgi:hypothetical protein